MSVENLEICKAERCEYNRSGYCGYFSVTGCERPCKPGEDCDFFGGSPGRKKPGKAKKQTKAEDEDKLTAGALKRAPGKTVVIYVDGAPGPVRLRGDCIIPGKDRLCVLRGNDLIGLVRDDEVLMVYIEQEDEHI